jgi:Protein of unknown function (DUF3071)
MQELRLVAVSEDGSYAVLVVPGRSGRFALPIDERLRTVARGQFSRLAQYEIEVESPLRPKEIQDRIRAGETAEEIADVAGLPVDRIRRFEGPVLAEREYQATQAQRATVRIPGESGTGQRLGDVLAQRLPDLGASADDQDWDSRKRQDGNWQVQLAYTVAGRMFVAEWVYDPKSKHVTPADDEAIRLSLDEAHWPEPPSAGSAVKATVTPIGSRLAGGHHPAEHRGESDRPTASRTLQHPSRAVPSTAQGTSPVHQSPGHQSPGHQSPGQPQPVHQPEPRPQPVPPALPAPAAQAAPALPAPAAQPAPEGQPAPAVQPPPVRPAAASSQAEQAGHQPAVAKAPGNGRSEQQARPPAAPQAAQEPGPEPSPPATPEATEREPEEAPRPARRASGGRSRRSSVPSWDEIMFGNSRQPE